jgi:hypothetical protein
MVNGNFTPLKNNLNQNGSNFISSSLKEVEPHKNKGDLSEKLIMHEVKEYDIDNEAAKYIEKRHNAVDVKEDLQKIGVIPVETFEEPIGFKEIRLPISDDKVVTGLKQPITSSFRWLAEFALFLLKQAHTTIRQIHGKIIRIRLK